MRLSEKRNELINLILSYLDGGTSLDEMNNFSWEVIAYFTDTLQIELPPIEDFENEFWYAIWQIQHLADESHENEGITKKELKYILEFLIEKKKLPNGFYGLRPNQSK